MASLPAPAAFALGVLTGAGALLLWQEGGESQKTPAIRLDPPRAQAAPRPPATETPSRLPDSQTVSRPQDRPPMTVPDGGAQEWMASWEAFSRPPDREHFLQSLIESLGRQRPDEVLAFLKSLPASPARSHALTHELLVLAEASPARALTLTSETLQGIEAQNAQGAILEHWATVNPREALAWAASQPVAARSLEAVEQTVAAAAAVDPAQTRQLLESLQNLGPEQRQTAGRALVGVWAQSAPAAALAWAKAAAASGTAAQDLVQIAYLNWAANDPATAAAALARNDPALLPTAAGELAGMWAQADPPAAAAWLLANPAAGGREPAIGQIAGTWALSDPTAAMDWARQIPPTDPARTEALRSASLFWLRSDPDAFQRHFSTLPAEVQREIGALTGQARR